MNQALDAAHICAIEAQKVAEVEMSGSFMARDFILPCRYRNHLHMCLAFAIEACSSVRAAQAGLSCLRFQAICAFAVQKAREGLLPSLNHGIMPMGQRFEVDKQALRWMR